jgi:hypothetical protein
VDETDEELIDGWPEEEPEAPDFLGPCPDWCKGRPHLENTSEFPQDQSHDSEPVGFQVDVAAGPAEVCAFAQIVWQPYAERPERREVYVSMHWECESRRLGPADILKVADGIEAYAGRLRELAAQLADIRAGELPDHGEPSKIT